jgi:phosphoribosylformylglycinamidine cyclo-ligase
MGVGMIAAVAETEVDATLEQLRAAGENAWRIGSVVEGDGVRGLDDPQ